MNTCDRLTPNALRAFPLLAPLSDSQLAWLHPTTVRRTFVARACILRAGNPADGLYLIAQGRVQLMHEDQDGRALVADLYGPGEMFGEMGLIDASACPVSAVAVQPCELAFIPRGTLLELLEMNPRTAMTMLRTALDRLCKAHRQMGNLALTDVYTRVSQLLETHGHAADGEWHVDVGSQQIAAMAGSSREMVSRVLRCMIQKGLVRRNKRKLIVIDRAALRAPAKS